MVSKKDEEKLERRIQKLQEDTSLAGMVGILAVFVFVSAMFADASGRPIEIVFEYDQIQALVWLFLGPITVIPTVSLALRTPGRKVNK